MDYKLESITEMSRSDKSVVYLAALPSGQLVIRKVLFAARNAELYRRLQKAALPCLPKILEVTTNGEETIVLEDYVAGQELAKVLKADVTKEQGLHYMEELLKAISLLHEMNPPVLHRDVKPENILITEDGRLVLIDLDAAREWTGDGKERDTQLLGTRGYAAPEQFGYSQTDVRSDLYSAGIVCGMIGERMQFSKAEKRRFKTFLDKATMFDPKERFQSAREMLRALRTVFCPRQGKLAAFALVAILGILVVAFAWMSIRYYADRGEMRSGGIAAGNEQGSDDGEVKQESSIGQGEQVSGNGENGQESGAEEEMYDFEILPVNYRYRGVYVRLLARDDTAQFLSKEPSDLPYETEGAEGFYAEGQECAIGTEFPLLRFLKSSPQAILQYDCRCENQQIASVYLERYSAGGTKILDRILLAPEGNYEIRYGFFCLNVAALNKLQEGIYYLRIMTRDDIKWEYYLQIHGPEEKVDEFAPRVLGGVQYYSLAMENDLFYNVYNTPHKIKNLYCNDLIVPKEDYDLTSDGRGVLFHKELFQTCEEGAFLNLRFEMENHRNAYGRAIIIR